ncbi:multidrug export protein MepA [Clostridium saccharobutylicum]|uniref:MATE family efflux transporter n=1 Tax=Clostridium saccharobutylicum TaxID=169679 RepID=UPI000983EDAE|nr:MATE family efflux transporter [Clostridium saccharobutylicum]AQS08502.1 multidrug export protein MepA [Clostridium saccharobutylicum]MBC2435981.1 MATE family efflux transporter [Clostridium saccharobutylicum]NSB87748.1 putative MATE family efflux protein [Clostridium saccharobutylicum]NYC29158.1 putative MATE family efflux protein [Clostridium saccharobutylicum]OOM12272.1 multidrug export protein MepA [Clostridium saccharobutylicum]
MKKIDLTEGKVINVITALALPIMGSSLLQFTYNLVDMLWVGGLGSNAVASIGSSSLYIGLGYSINSLVVIGAGIKVAQGIGRKDNNQVKEYINAGIFINLLMGLILGSALIFIGKELIGFLHIENVVVERDAYYYLALNGPILFFTFFNTLYARILGSFGNNKLALKINALGLVLNIILDPMFIYTFKFGVLGAAISTLIANIIMFIVYLVKSSGILKFNFQAGIDKKKIIKIIRLGLPMAFQRILFTIINIMLAKIVASFGSDAIAGQKIGLEIESVMYMVVGGLNGAVSSFTGQNFGAKKFNRIKEGYNGALKIGIIYSLIIALAFLFLNKPLIRLFIREENTIMIAAVYLQMVAFSQVFSTLEMVSNGLFTGIGKPNIPATISVVFTALRIPMSLILIKPFGVNGIWISIALSSILKGSFAYLLYCVKVKRKYKEVKI